MELLFSANRAILVSAAILFSLSDRCAAKPLPPSSPPILSPAYDSSTNPFFFSPAAFDRNDAAGFSGAQAGLPGNPIVLGDRFFTLENLSALGLEKDSISGDVESSSDSTGEPGRLLLVAAVVLAVVMLAVKAHRSTAQTATPPAPVRTLTVGRSWAQPGATFLPPRSEVEAIDPRRRPSPFAVPADTEPTPAQ